MSSTVSIQNLEESVLLCLENICSALNALKIIIPNEIYTKFRTSVNIIENNDEMAFFHKTPTFHTVAAIAGSNRSNAVVPKKFFVAHISNF